jgi:hypothetical protein
VPGHRVNVGPAAQRVDEGVVADPPPAGQLDLAPFGVDRGGPVGDEVHGRAAEQLRDRPGPYLLPRRDLVQPYPFHEAVARVHQRHPRVAVPRGHVRRGQARVARAENQNARRHVTRPFVDVVSKG